MKTELFVYEGRKQERRRRNRDRDEEEEEKKMAMANKRARAIEMSFCCQMLHTVICTYQLNVFRSIK